MDVRCQNPITTTKNNANKQDLAHTILLSPEDLIYDSDLQKQTVHK